MPMRYGGIRYSLRQPLHRHIQSLGELRDGLGGSGTPPTFKIGQIALTDTRFGIQILLRLAAPLANGLQPTLASNDCSTNFRGQDDTAGRHFGLSGIVDYDVVGVLGLV